MVSNQATQPHGSSGAGWQRWNQMRCLMRFGLAAIALAVPSLSPTSQWKMWFVLASRSGRSSTLSDFAVNGSATTGSGAYSTCTASAPSAAAARVSANTAATS